MKISYSKNNILVKSNLYIHSYTEAISHKASSYLDEFNNRFPSNIPLPIRASGVGGLGIYPIIVENK